MKIWGKYGENTGKIRWFWGNAWFWWVILGPFWDPKYVWLCDFFSEPILFKVWLRLSRTSWNRIPVLCFFRVGYICRDDFKLSLGYHDDRNPPLVTCKNCCLLLVATPMICQDLLDHTGSISGGIFRIDRDLCPTITKPPQASPSTGHNCFLTPLVATAKVSGLLWKMPQLGKEKQQLGIQSIHSQGELGTSQGIFTAVFFRGDASEHQRLPHLEITLW